MNPRDKLISRLLLLNRRLNVNLARIRSPEPRDTEAPLWQERDRLIAMIERDRQALRNADR